MILNRNTLTWLSCNCTQRIIERAQQLRLQLIPVWKLLSVAGVPKSFSCETPPHTWCDSTEIRDNSRGHTQLVTGLTPGSLLGLSLARDGVGSSYMLGKIQAHEVFPWVDFPKVVEINGGNWSGRLYEASYESKQVCFYCAHWKREKKVTRLVENFSCSSYWNFEVWILTIEAIQEKFRREG